jgi:AcrR family transcriptional regulator
VPPDSTASRARLLAAAFEEFAQYGLAGARVNRIAEAAQANKRLIYVYYGNKGQLFNTVLTQRVGAVFDAVPFTAEDLPAFAGALFDHLWPVRSCCGWATGISWNARIRPRPNSNGAVRRSRPSPMHRSGGSSPPTWNRPTCWSCS